MFKLVIIALASFLSCGVSVAGPDIVGPDDAAARMLAEANIPDCRVPTPSTGIKEWRHETADENSQLQIIWGFPCDRGSDDVWVVWTVVSWTKYQGYEIASLPLPQVSLRDGKMIGLSASTRIRGASYDPKSRLLSANYDDFLGRDDAGVRGTWLLFFGDFRLVSFEADVHFDGKLEFLPVISFDCCKIPGR